MKTVFSFFLAFLPSFLHVNIRRLAGQKIGRGAKLRFGTILISRKIKIGARSKIGPFTYIRTQNLSIGNHTIVKSLVVIKSLEVLLKNNVHIAPLCIINSEFTKNSSISIGNHSRIFPFCWLDSGEGITIGDHVGVGGHTLMFTHGVWSNYVDGAPISFGPITIKDNVWLPWRVFILPNVTIGANAIIGANSLISSDVEENVLAAGSPAKTIKPLEFDDSKRIERMQEIIASYGDYINFQKKISSRFDGNTLHVNGSKIVINENDNLSKNDLLVLMDGQLVDLKSSIKPGVSVIDYHKQTIYLNRNKKKEITAFVSFLRRYGVRLTIIKAGWE